MVPRVPELGEHLGTLRGTGWGCRGVCAAAVGAAVPAQGASCHLHTAGAPQPHRTYLENLSARAEDLLLLTRESSFAVIFKDWEVHCLLLKGEGSILSPQIPAPEEGTVSATGTVSRKEVPPSDLPPASQCHQSYLTPQDLTHQLAWKRQQVTVIISSADVIEMVP